MRSHMRSHRYMFLKMPGTGDAGAFVGEAFPYPLVLSLYSADRLHDILGGRSMMYPALRPPPSPYECTWHSRAMAVFQAQGLRGRHISGGLHGFLVLHNSWCEESCLHLCSQSCMWSSSVQSFTCRLPLLPSREGLPQGCTDDLPSVQTQGALCNDEALLVSFHCFVCLSPLLERSKAMWIMNGTPMPP